ncbi:MAG: hypothetical protein DHS20C05_15440 [Hyphococcus sp.]|nr:MAG: hypothetical protein DHS20C05_15440 [Marinicaulis sp.]
MIAKFSKKKFSKKLAFCAVSSIAMLGFNASAQAGGGYYYGGGYGYYDNGYYDAYSYHHRSRRHGHHHSHGGGKGAAIALGIIGGAILINELAEERARDRAYEDRYERRYDRYSRRAQPVYSDPIIFPEDDYDEDAKADPLDDRLAGGDQARADDGGPAPIRYSYDQAYRTCMTHARAALSDRGFILAAPARPETAEEVGRAWKMTANVTAQNDRGESWNRAMYCEADDSRVYLLELI